MVVDAGFLEGRVLLYYRAQSARGFLKPHPLGIKTTPVFDRLERNFLLYLSIDPFLIEILLRHAKVSHKSSFLSSLVREGSSI